MQTAISVSKLSKAYGSVRAVDCLDLSVARGEAFGLLGANGAGKTTAMECMLGVRRADGGNVSILGMDPVRDRKRLFQQVGVQFQETSHQDKITVRELCGVTRTLYRAPADSRVLLKQFGLEDKEKSFVAELSGGQKQRLFIVLALIPSPAVVFLDELTTGLDARARRDVWKSLAQRKAEGLTILLTSHFMDEVEALCDRVCILKGGKAAFTGTIREAIAAGPFETFEDAYLCLAEEETLHEDL